MPRPSHFTVTALLLLFVLTAQVTRAQKPELVVQTGNTTFITTVALSPNGKILASGDFFNQIKLWDVPTTRELRTLNFTGTSIFTVSLVFSPDGSLLFVSNGVVAGNGKTLGRITVWDVSTGRELRTLVEVPIAISGLTISTDGKYLAGMPIDLSKRNSSTSGSNNKDSSNAAKIWDVATGRELPSPPAMRSLASLAFSPNSKVLALSGASNITLWDVASGQVLHSIEAGSMNLTFSPDGKMLASSVLQEVRLWDVATGQEIRKLSSAKGSFDFVFFNT